MRHQRQLVLVGAPALALCLVGPAAAGSISISIAPVVEPREGTLSAQVKVSNVGDETAQSVAAVLVFGEHKARGEIHPSLAPGASVDAALSLPVASSAPATGRTRSPSTTPTPTSNRSRRSTWGWSRSAARPRRRW